MSIKHARTEQRGFSLIEALVALVVVAFGLMTLVGVTMKLTRSADVAKQRSEATRLAQQKIEELRSFTQISAGPGVIAWDTLAGGSDTIAPSADYASNTSFARTWAVLGTITDPMRTVRVTVNWVDRIGDAQTLSYSSVISKTDPMDVGSLGFPLPANTTLKRPKNRDLNIPVPARELGDGKSAVQLLADFAIIFSNESGYVVQTCNKEVTSLADLEDDCTTVSAYIIAGYVSLSGPSNFPSGLAVNTAQISGTTGVICSLSDAVDQNSGATIAGYKYYLCVVSVPDPGDSWSGTVRLASPALNTGSTGYLVCRFQYPSASGVSANHRNVQPFTDVRESLDNLNYIITTSSSCPTMSSLATVQHQNCRSSGTNSVTVAQRALNCPAS